MKTNMIGILWFLCSLLVCNLSEIIVKHLTADVGFMQITACRFFFCVITLLPILLFKGKAILKTKRLPLHVMRALLLVGASALWYLGLKKVPLASATVISFSVPLFMLVFSSFLLKEQLSFYRIMMTVLGFVGVVIVVANHWLALTQGRPELMVIAAMFYALSNILNKKYAGEESILAMIFYPALIGCVISGSFTIPYWRTISLDQIGLCMILGLCANLILFCVIAAYKKSEATYLGPLHYLELIPSVTFGFFIFQEIPSLLVMSGAIVIILSSLLVIFEKTLIALFRNFSAKPALTSI